MVVMIVTDGGVETALGRTGAETAGGGTFAGVAEATTTVSEVLSSLAASRGVMSRSDLKR